MILVDTSVWVDHLRRGNGALATRLERGEVLCHPFIVGEISLGSLRQRNEVLGLLTELPMASHVPDAEVLALVARLELAGRGVGWVDVHLLASAIVDHAYLWTLDRRLVSVARVAKVSIDA